MKSDHKIISTAILPILLIEEGQLSVNGETVCPRSDLIQTLEPLKVENLKLSDI